QRTAEFLAAFPEQGVAAVLVEEVVSPLEGVGRLRRRAGERLARLAQNGKQPIGGGAWTAAKALGEAVVLLGGAAKAAGGVFRFGVRPQVVLGRIEPGNQHPAAAYEQAGAKQQQRQHDPATAAARRLWLVGGERRPRRRRDRAHDDRRLGFGRRPLAFGL